MNAFSSYTVVDLHILLFSDGWCGCYILFLVVSIQTVIIWIKHACKYNEYQPSNILTLYVYGMPPMGLLPYVICRLRMRRECRERFPSHRLQRKPLVSDPGMHRGTCVTHVPWCMTESLIHDGGENVPGIPGACATRTWQEAHGNIWRWQYTTHHMFDKVTLQTMTWRRIDNRHYLFFSI